MPFGTGPFGDLPFGGLPDVTTDPLIGFEIAVELGALSESIDTSKALNGFQLAVELGAFGFEVDQGEPLSGFSIAVSLGILKVVVPKPIIYTTLSDSAFTNTSVSDQAVSSTELGQL